MALPENLNDIRSHLRSGFQKTIPRFLCGLLT